MRFQREKYRLVRVEGIGHNSSAPLTRSARKLRNEGRDPASAPHSPFHSEWGPAPPAFDPFPAATKISSSNTMHLSLYFCARGRNRTFDLCLIRTAFYH